MVEEGHPSACHTNCSKGIFMVDCISNLHVFMSCVFYVFESVHCCLVFTCWERAGLFALVCDVWLCFCHFPKWYPRSGVVLDCIHSWSLSYFLLWERMWSRSASLAMSTSVFKALPDKLDIKIHSPSSLHLCMQNETQLSYLMQLSVFMLSLINPFHSAYLQTVKTQIKCHIRHYTRPRCYKAFFLAQLNWARNFICS